MEVYDKVGKGKYTIGLGQLAMSFVQDREDINSISLTALKNLLTKYNVDPRDVGRLEVGTETLLDKAKSMKTILMSLFKECGNHDIEGVTSINACYGSTNAIFNTLNWVESRAWDGRYGIVISSDVAVYPKGNARATGGAGAIAILIGPDAPIVVDPIRSTFVDNEYDFYKPNPSKCSPRLMPKKSSMVMFVITHHFCLSCSVGVPTCGRPPLHANLHECDEAVLHHTQAQAACFLQQLARAQAR